MLLEKVLIPLPGIGTLELPRDVYERCLRPIEARTPAEPAEPQPATDLVTAKVLAHQLSLPVSCLYEYAKAKRIPSVRVGRHVRFDPMKVRAALSATGELTGGRA